MPFISRKLAETERSLKIGPLSPKEQSPGASLTRDHPQTAGSSASCADQRRGHVLCITNDMPGSNSEIRSRNLSDQKSLGGHKPSRSAWVMPLAPTTPTQSAPARSKARRWPEVFVAALRPRRASCGRALGSLACGAYPPGGIQCRMSGNVKTASVSFNDALGLRVTRVWRSVNLSGDRKYPTSALAATRRAPRNGRDCSHRRHRRRAGPPPPVARWSRGCSPP